MSVNQLEHWVALRHVLIHYYYYYYIIIIVITPLEASIDYDVT